ncbi:MAG: GNAT family N-acetyltransferase [Halothiobacillaceae bacterium]|jgi:ribosomal protein S18 acetylase RimI-like enzyme|nr:GNAT family N-acetyltransferase [Halothiobacillaceae bacterium]
MHHSNECAEQLVEMHKAAREDVPLIRELAERIWRVHYPGIIGQAQIEYMLSRMYALDRLREEIDGGQVEYLVMEIDAEAVGFMALRDDPESDSLRLDKLYLDPKLHGRGLGALMLAECERRARERARHRIVLHVNRQNQRALRAYRRAGFSVAGESVTDIGQGFVMDDYRMEKPLGG